MRRTPRVRDRRRGAAIVSLLGLLATSEASADEPEVTPEVEPVEVEIVGDSVDAIQRVPGSLELVRRDEIEQIQPTSVSEILGRVPGIVVREDTSAGMRLDIGVRGLDPGRSRRLLVLEDGAPLAINPYAEPDLYFIPQVERMSSVEILKGSGSILFGPQTLGGVINFKTFAPPDHFQSMTRIEAGQFGYGRVVARLGDSFGAVRAAAQLTLKRTDGATGQGSRDADIVLKWAFPTADGSEAIVKLAYHRASADSDDVGLTRAMFEETPDRPSLSPSSYLVLDRYDLSVTHATNLDELGSFKILAYASVTDRLWSRQVYDRFPVPGQRYERIVGDVDLPLGALYFKDESRILDRLYWVMGIEPRLSLTFPTGRITHALDVGLRGLFEGADLVERDGASKYATDGTIALEDKHDSIAFAAYAQDRISFLPELVLTPGVRFEYVRYARTVTRGSEVSGSDAVATVIPGVGLTLGTRAIHGFGGIHVGYAPPRLTDAVASSGAAQSLEAERSVQVELGARGSLDDVFHVDLTAFGSRFANQVVPATRPGARTELENGGATATVGLEGDIALDLLALFDAEGKLDAWIRPTLMRARFLSGDNDGQRLPFASDYILAAGLDLALPFGLKVGASVIHTGAQYADAENTRFPDASGRVGLIPATSTVDATVRHRIADTGFDVWTLGKNLLDQRSISSRRPEGIHVGGFRQLIFGIGYTIE